MGGRADRSMSFQHAYAAERRLRHNKAKRRPAKAAHPPTGLDARDPNSQRQRKNRDNSRDHAMNVFVPDAADHWGNQSAVRERPVRNGIRGVVAGDQRARNEQHNSAGTQKDRELMNSA